MFDGGGDLVREANHRVANSLALIASLVRIRASKLVPADASITCGEVSEMLDAIAARIATVGQLHRLLAYRHDGEAFDLSAHLKEICSALIAALSSSERPISLEFGGMECVVPARHAQPLSLIVSELVMNAIKYAHPAGLALRITVSCARNDAGGLVLSVEDDGVGLPEGFDPERDGGLGFRVIRSLADGIGAKHRFESDGLGTRFRLTLPAVPG